MDDHGLSNERSDHGARLPADATSAWVTRYAAKHRWRRLTDLPAGVQVPAKVRLYQRTDHFILQWWDPAAKRNLAERVDGDLLAALCRARLIAERLADRRTAGTGRRRLGHDELVQRYVTDLQDPFWSGQGQLAPSEKAPGLGGSGE